MQRNDELFSIDDLPKHLGVYIRECLSIPQLLGTCRVSMFWKDRALEVATTDKIKNDPQLQKRFRSAFNKEMQKPCGSEKEEAQLASRVDSFIRLGLSVDIPEPMYLAIHFAVGNGHAEVLKRLYAHQIDVNQVCPDAAHLAISKNQAAVIEVLHENGFDLEKRRNDKGKNAPVHGAVASGSEEVLRALSDAGVNWNTKNWMDHTPLQMSLDICFGESREKIEKQFKLFLTLLELGACPKNEGEFLSWLSHRLESVVPSFADPFSGLGLHFMDDDYFRQAANQIEMIPAFLEATAWLQAEVAKALKNQRIENENRAKFFAKKEKLKDKSQEQNEIELETFRKS